MAEMAVAGYGMKHSRVNKYNINDNFRPKKVKKMQIKTFTVHYCVNYF